MADQGAELPQVAVETVTLTGEDGTTHIYTVDSDGIVAGLPNPEQATEQNVLVENDGQVFYFVQSEAEAMQGVSYVVIDEEGNESNVVTVEEGDAHHANLSNVEFLQTLSEPSTSSIQLQAARSVESQVILIEGNDAVQTEKDVKQSEEFQESETKFDEESGHRDISDVNNETQMDVKEDTEDGECVKYILFCQCCGEALDTLQELKDHLMEFHGISDDVEEPEESFVEELEDVSEFAKCSQCTDIFMNEKDLHDHITIEHCDQENHRPVDNKVARASGHKCQFCVRTFDVRSDLDSHIEQEHDVFDDFIKKRDSWYSKCPYCPRMYLSKWCNKSLRRHVRVDHPGKGLPVNIEMVEVEDKSSLRKLKGEVVSDSNEKQFPCRYCPKVFHWLKSLTRHMRMFHGEQLDPLNAEQRMKILGTRERRRKNLREAVDELYTVYSCPYCPKMFLWQKSLKRHMVEFHSDIVDDFDENIVGIKTRKRRLVATGREYFKCLHCSLVSKYSYSIKSHMVRKHPEVEGTDLKEITLPTVDASVGVQKAKANDPRSREERLSECAVVFKCPKCSYASKNQSNLHRHLTSKVHKEDFTKEDLEEKKMSFFKVKQNPSDSDSASLNTVKNNSSNLKKKGTEDKIIGQVDAETDDVEDTTFQADDHVLDTAEKIQQKYRATDIPKLCKASNNLKVTFQCPECSDHVFHFEKLQEHYKIEHPGIPFVVTEDEVLAVEHIKKPLQVLKALECPYCELILSQVHVLQQHIILNHQACVDRVDIKQEPVDAECEASDIYKADGTMTDSCSNCVVTAYRCQACICVFPEILELVRHMGIIHPSSDISDSKTPKKRGRKRKVQETGNTCSPPEPTQISTDTRSSVSQYENKCPHCPFSCKRASALAFHINFNHANIKTEPETEDTPRKKSRKDYTRDKITDKDHARDKTTDKYHTPGKTNKDYTRDKIADKDQTSDKTTDKNHSKDKTTNKGHARDKRTNKNHTREKAIDKDHVGDETTNKDDTKDNTTKKDHTREKTTDKDNTRDKTIDKETMDKTIDKETMDKTIDEDHASDKTTYKDNTRVKTDNNRTKNKQLSNIGKKSDKSMPSSESDFDEDVELFGDDDVLDADYKPDEDEKVNKPVVHFRRHKCPHCDVGAFISARTLVRHVKREHPEESKTFSLSDSKPVESYSIADTATVQNTKKHTCTYCKKSFTSQKNVSDHMNKEHKFLKNDVNKGRASSKNVVLEDHEGKEHEIRVSVPQVLIPTEIDTDNSAGDGNEKGNFQRAVPLQDQKAVDVVKRIAGSLRFKCKYCNMLFLSKISVIRHAIALHPNKKKLEETEIEPILNETDKTLENIFQCPYCDHSSAWKKCIVKHVNKVHPEISDFNPDDIQIEIGLNLSKGEPKLPEVSQYQCPYCQSIQKWKKSIIRHIRTMHPQEHQNLDLKALCIAPDLKTSNAITKLLGAHPKRLVHCTVCNFTCRVIQKMQKHFRESHPEESKMATKSMFKYSYIRDDAGSESNSQTEGGRVSQDSHSCPLCQTSYAWKKSLNHHMKLHHPDEAEVYETVQSMVNIVDRALGDTTRPKKRSDKTCAECGTTFRTSCAKQMHINGKHGPHAKYSFATAVSNKHNRVFRCGVCKMGFRRRNALVKHRACRHLRSRIFPCGHCGKRCCSKQSLAVHTQNCQETRLWLCNKPNCNFRYALKSSLKIHLRRHHQPQLLTNIPHAYSSVTYSCELCSKEFQRSSLLKEHLKEEHFKKSWHLVGIERKMKQYLCKSCNVAFALPSLRDKHFAEMHKDKAEMCEICGNIFSTMSNLRRHYARHQQTQEGEGRRSRCDLCGIDILRRNLPKHYIFKHPESCACECEICTSQSAIGPYVKECNLCKMRFCRKMMLSAHKRVVHQFAEESKYRCKYCSKLFTTNRERYVHMHTHIVPGVGRPTVGESQPEANLRGDNVAVVGEDKEASSTHVIHISEGQGMQYLPKLSEASLSAVIKELMIVSTDKMCKLPYKCLLCGRCFAKTKYIRLHIRRNHVKDEDQPYRCKICGSGFVRLTEFRKHSRAHSGFRPYKCKICSKAFKQQANLTDHINTHNATKAFSCFICKKYFRQRGALNAHIVRHDTLKPFKCTFCDKGFTTRGELSRHMQHYDLGEGRSKGTGARSFMCHICQESFSHFPLLLKHIEELHPERPFQCQVCGQKFAAYISLYTHKLKTEHFLPSEIEIENVANRNIQKKSRSARDVQEAVLTIEQGETEIGHDLNDMSVNDSMLIIQSGDLYEVPTSGKPLEVVIEQFQAEEVVQGSQVRNENEELLSIAKKLTELSSYTETEVAEVDTAAVLQEEDEIMKGMLDADHDLLANIGKQLTVTKKEEEDWQDESTMEGFTTNETLENSSERVEISQGVDLTVSVGEAGQSEVTAASGEGQVVGEVTRIKEIPSNMEELATLIAQNSQKADAVTAYQTEDGSIIYLCMEQTNPVKETNMDVATTTEYLETCSDLVEIRNDFENQDQFREEIVLEEHAVEMQETNTVSSEDEDMVDNVEGVGNQDSNHLIRQVIAESEIGQAVIREASQLEEHTNNNRAYTKVQQNVEEYIHDEQTFMKEELINNVYTMVETATTNPTDSEIWREHDSNIYKCLKCSYTCANNKNMNKHINRHMPVASRPHVCDICNKRFVTKSELLRHMCTHTGERKHQCQYCSKTFKQPGHLQSHVRSHLGQKEYACPDCPLQFITKTQCKTHWQRQHSKERFHCEKCGKSFTDKHGLKKHKGAVHSGVFPRWPVGPQEKSGAHQCDVCGLSFAKRDSLKYHLSKHNPEEDLPKFICEVCGESFKAKHMLTSHISLKHSDEKPEICEYCGMAFKLKKQLNYHIHSKHKVKKRRRSNKVYTCVCGKKFNTRTSMAYHIGASERCQHGKVTVEEGRAENAGF